METANPEFVYPRRRVIRMVLRRMAAAALATVCDLCVLGQENIPEQGPLLVVGNHFSFIRSP